MLYFTQKWHSFNFAAKQTPEIDYCSIIHYHYYVLLLRRKCPGESIGKLVTPLYFISILQHYSVILAEGQDIDIYGEQYGVYMTSPYKIILRHRKQL